MSDQIDVNAIADSLNSKADIDMANVPSNIGSIGKSYFAGIGMPSGTYETLTIGASGSSYTAQKNGWFICAWQGCTAVDVYTSENTVGYCFAVRSDQFFRCSIPVLKGNKLTVAYSGTPSSVIFRFVPSEGEV